MGWDRISRSLSERGSQSHRDYAEEGQFHGGELAEFDGLKTKVLLFLGEDYSPKCATNEVQPIPLYIGLLSDTTQDDL